MGIVDTLQRIPSEYVAALVSVVAAWTFLRFARNEQTRSVLSGLTFEFLFAYIIIARLSGMFLHPHELLQMSVWTLLAQAPSEGWVFGLSGGIVVLLWRLRQQKALNWDTFRAATNAALFGLAIWWLIRIFIDQGPFLTRTIGMLIMTVVLLLFSLQKRARPILPHRIWSIMAVVSLLTSIGLPKITQFVYFTPIQWFAVVLLFTGLGVEAAIDIQKQKDLHRRPLQGSKE